MKKKLFLLEIGSFISTVAPLIVLLAVKWGAYTQCTAGELRLCIGGLLVVAAMALKAFGKLKMPPRVWTYAILLAMSWLLESLLQDMQMIFTVALLGECLDLIFFQSAIQKAKKENDKKETADAVVDAVKEYLGSGRM